jgi:hypothetical protein
MNLLESILKSQGGGAVSQIASQFGLGEDQAATAITNLVPALAGGLQRNISQGGLESLLGALTKGQHQRYLDEPTTLGSPSVREDGNGILGHILGSKDLSRKVAAQASARTGISESILKQMLPVVAAAVMGAMGKQTGAAASAGVGSATGSRGGSDILGMLTPFLDSDRDGSVADDILGSVSRFFKK